MSLALAIVVVLLAALIVAIVLDVKVSIQTSAIILVACGAVSVVLILSSSRLTADRNRGINRQSTPSGVVSTDTGQISNWIFLADAYVERAEFESAEKLYRRAANAGHVGAMARLGEVLYELGRDDEAEYYRRRAREAGQ